MHQRISRHELTDTSGVSGTRRMKKNLSGSTPQLVHHGVAALKYNDAAEMSRRAIVAKYLSPPPAALAALGKDKVWYYYFVQFIYYVLATRHTIQKFNPQNIGIITINTANSHFNAVLSLLVTAKFYRCNNIGLWRSWCKWCCCCRCCVKSQVIV